MRGLNEYTRKELMNIRLRDWNEDIGTFDYLIIVPMRYKHDSGFACMDFIACKGEKPICRLSGCSDVIHINGRGGYGHNWLKKYGRVPELIKPTAWSIDCLYTSKLLRMFTKSGKITVSEALSSFDLYCEETK